MLSKAHLYYITMSQTKCCEETKQLLSFLPSNILSELDENQNLESCNDSNNNVRKIINNYYFIIFLVFFERK